MKLIDSHLNDGVKHIIWDWNGTLLNDVSLCVQVINGLLEAHHLDTISDQQYRATFRFPVIQYYASLGFDFTAHPFEKVADLFIEDYNARVKECSLFEGASDLVRSFEGKGLRQSILSAARERDLKELVEHYGLAGHLDAICGLGDHYAAGKIERGKKMIEESGLDPRQCLLIGDTEHDVEVAHSLGTPALILADGHQDADRLKDLRATVLASRY